MTKFELSQPESTIKNAGRIAFMLGVPSATNPYRKNKSFQHLWGIGFKNAKHLDDKKRTATGRYRVYFEPVITNPTCTKCSIPVPNTYCIQCGDSYESTEIDS